MKEPSLFDVIGPVMIGPSSSHTAGALRISLILNHLLKDKKIVEAQFVLYGSFAKTYKGHGTDKALVAGILGYDMDDIRIRDSFSHAKKAGIKVSFETDTSPNDFHPNAVKITASCDDGYSITIVGESVGGGLCVIRQINGIDVKLTGELSTILVYQIDRPGVLSYITSCLNNYNINIAFARLYRENKGERAYTIIETDDKIPERAIESIKNGNNINNAILIEL